MKHVAQIVKEAGGLDGLLKRGRRETTDTLTHLFRTSEDLRALRKAVGRTSRNGDNITPVEVVRVQH
jgi:hypothetical protein